jgi:hypothetical protein
MDHPVLPPRYFRDALGAVLSLGSAVEPTPGGGWHATLTLHRLGWIEGRLKHRCEDNLVAQLQATTGAADEHHAVVFCRVRVLGDASAEQSTGFMVERMLDRLLAWSGRREVRGEVSVEVDTGADSAGVQHYHFALHVDEERQRHYQVPAMVQLDGLAAVSAAPAANYIEIKNPLPGALPGEVHEVYDLFADLRPELPERRKAAGFRQD